MKSLIITLAVSLVCVLVLSSCGTSGSTTTSVTPSSPTVTRSATTPPTSIPVSTGTANKPSTNYGGTMRVIAGGPGAPIGLPGEGTGGSYSTTNICTDFLLRGDDKGNLTPAMATSYDIDPGAKNSSITFHLRKGVKFHDGTDFNAQALKWNFELLKNSPLQTNNTNFWTSFEVIDDYTFKINMTGWQNRFAAAFANTPTQIVSPTAYQNKGVEWMRWNIVGTGPFVQTDFQRDVVFKAKRFDNYWETGKPYLDEVQLLYISDPTTSKMQFMSEGADAWSLGGNFLMASDLSKLGYPIMQLITGGIDLMPDSMNADSAWSNPKVRMAAEYAIDKESLIKLGFGYMTASYQVPSPNSVAYDPSISGRKYDAAKAKQLLAEAGYAGGFKTTLIYADNINKDVVVAVQNYLANVGIQAELELTPPAKAAQYMSGTWHNALLVGTPAEAPNFSITLNAFFRPAPGPGLWMSVKKPDGYEAAYNAALTSPQQDAALLKKCTDLFYNDATVIPLYNAPTLWVTCKNLQDAGFGKRLSLIQSNPQDAWFKK